MFGELRTIFRFTPRMKNTLLKYCLSVVWVLLSSFVLFGSAPLLGNSVLNQEGNLNHAFHSKSNLSTLNASVKGFSSRLETDILLIEISENEEEKKLGQKKTYLTCAQAHLYFSDFYLIRSRNIRSCAKQTSLLIPFRPLFLKFAVFRV